MTHYPVQEFQIGQRVRPHSGEPAFMIVAMMLSSDGQHLIYSDGDRRSYRCAELTLAPSRPPYVPSERQILDRDTGGQPKIWTLFTLYRCETDDELAVRHASERATYDAQGDVT